MHLVLFNSFPFHYEMFGCFIWYSIHKNYNITIYTETSNEMGWLEFYRQLKPDLVIKDYRYFVREITASTNLPVSIILVTDDDPRFPIKAPDNRVICIDHDLKIRNKQIKCHIATRPFKPLRAWMLPVFPIVDIDTKKSMNANSFNSTSNSTSTSSIKVVMIASQYNDFSQIYKFRNANNIPIELIYVGRGLFTRDHVILQDLSKKFKTTIKIKLNTLELIELLVKSHYVLVSSCHKSYLREKMSGAIPLAFATGCQLLMHQPMIDEYQFKSALTISETTVELPDIPDYDAVFAEQTSLLKHFDNTLSSCL